MKKKKKKSSGCKALCCSCRISVSSSEEAESSDRFESNNNISSIAHAMVQERLDQMITEARIRRRGERSSTKFVVMVATEMATYDPREDFRESMEQMIVASGIRSPKDLRRLLNYYLAMNSHDFQGVILEVFHEVCTRLFLYCRPHSYGM